MYIFMTPNEHNIKIFFMVYLMILITTNPTIDLFEEKGVAVYYVGVRSLSAWTTYCFNLLYLLYICTVSLNGIA
jgi:hypothetical protein